MISRQDVFGVYIKLISDLYHVDTTNITEMTSFEDDMNFDDLDHIELVIAAENSLNLEFEDVIANFRTVGDAVTYVMNLIPDDYEIPEFSE